MRCTVVTLQYYILLECVNCSLFFFGGFFSSHFHFIGHHGVSRSSDADFLDRLALHRVTDSKQRSSKQQECCCDHGKATKLLLSVALSHAIPP